MTMVSPSSQSLTQYRRSRLLQEAALLVLLSLLLIAFSGTGTGPDLNTEGLPGHADFTPAHESVFIPTQERVLVNARDRLDPEDASETGDDAGLLFSATTPGFCSPSSPRYTSIDRQHPLLQSSACPARAPPHFS